MRSFIYFLVFIFLINACVPTNYTNYANTTKASTYDYQGKPDSAVYFYTQAILVEKNSADLYQKRAMVYNKMNKFPEAMTDINKAIAMSSRSWNFYYSRAVILEKQGKWEMAIPDYSTYITRTDKKAAELYLGYWGRGKCYFSIKNYNDATSDFSQSILLKPTDLNLLTWRASVYFDSKRYAEAIKDYEAYMIGNPKDLK